MPFYPVQSGGTSNKLPLSNYAIQRETAKNRIIYDRKKLDYYYFLTSGNNLI